MADESAPETESVTFRMRITRMPRVTVTYKDKHDLFEAFKKKMAELGVSVDEVFWVGAEYEPIQMNDADSVMKAAKALGAQKLHVIDDADEEWSSSPRCDESGDHRRGRCSTEHNHGGHPRPRDRCGGHCRPSERPPHHHHHHHRHHHRHHHQNPVPACVPCSCSTWCPTMGTGCGCGCFHGF